ncbi:MAG: tetratricopeptide repeat protein [Gemmatimonadota bacterium]
MKSYQQFLAELKRRHVFRVAAIYGATAFVVLQVAELMLPRLGLPDWTVTFMVALVLLAFPVAMILAWAFQVTPDGVRRTEAAAAGEIEGILEHPASKRWPAGVLALIGVAALASTWWIARRTAPGDGDAAEQIAMVGGVRLVDLADDPRPSIAVLPFDDMSPEGDQEYFSDGMTEEILNVLAKIRELRVAARTSTFALKDQDLTATQWGDTLRVRYFVEGSVRKAGDRLRITAQLIDASDGSHLWSDQYDRSLDDVFAIQSEIAEAIAGQLRVPLGLDDPAELVSPVSDFAAYDLYLTGRARMRERGTSVAEAIGLFEAAIAVDSAWAPAWAGLAEATEIQLWYPDFDEQGPVGRDSVQVAEVLTDAELAARRALQLDRGSASAHVALGSVLRDRFEWAEAERAYRDALALDPDNSEAHQQYAEMLHATGRVADAVLAAARAAALDPAPIRFNILGFTLASDDRLEEARQAYEKGMALDPEGELVGGLSFNLAQLYFDAKRFEQAYEILRPLALEFFGADPEQIDADWAERLSWLRQETLSAVPDTARENLFPEGWMHLREPDSAAAFLAAPDQGFEISWLYQMWKPIFDPIRSHPRMQEYLTTRGLAGVTVQRTPPDERQTPEILRGTESASQPEAASETEPAPATDTP